MKREERPLNLESRTVEITKFETTERNILKKREREERGENEKQENVTKDLNLCQNSRRR